MLSPREEATIDVCSPVCLSWGLYERFPGVHSGSLVYIWWVTEWVNELKLLPTMRRHHLKGWHLRGLLHPWNSHLEILLTGIVLPLWNPAVKCLCVLTRVTNLRRVRRGGELSLLSLRSSARVRVGGSVVRFWAQEQMSSLSRVR